MSCVSYVDALTVAATPVNNNLAFDVRIFKTKKADAITADGTLKNNDSGGTASLYTNADKAEGAAKSDFQITTVWKEIFCADKAANVTENSAGAATLIDGAQVVSTTYSVTKAGLKQVLGLSTATTTKYDVICKLTVTIIVEPAASTTASKLNTNDLLYSQALATFDQ